MSLVKYSPSAFNLYNFCFVQPLYSVYSRTWWTGRADNEICATLTHVPADFWLSSPAAQLECSDLIERDFDKWIAIQEYIVFNVFLFSFLFIGSCGLYRALRAFGSKLHGWITGLMQFSGD